MDSFKISFTSLADFKNQDKVLVEALTFIIKFEIKWRKLREKMSTISHKKRYKGIRLDE